MSSNRDRQGGFGAAIPSSMQLSPQRRKLEAEKRAKQERAWRDKSGPVKTTWKCICPNLPCRAHP